jgi:hypothetical protein
VTHPGTGRRPTSFHQKSVTVVIITAANGLESGGEKFIRKGKWEVCQES